MEQDLHKSIAAKEPAEFIKTVDAPGASTLSADTGERNPLEQQLAGLTRELREVERQRGVFIRQRDEYEAETKRLYAALAAKDEEIREVERQRGVFIRQRDEYEAETEKLYAGHTAMEEEINFWKFRHDETSALHERVVEQKWSGKRPYKDYCCTFPFERIEILPRGEVYTCCSGALKSGYHIGNIYTDDFARMWNCEKVKKLRYAVTKGDFEYCLEYCVWLSNRGQLDNSDETRPVQKRNGAVFPYASWQECEVSQLPKWIALSCDESCNLQCPSCRSCKKALNKEESRKVFQMLMEKIRPNLSNCERLDLLGSGDVFASAACSDFLKTLTAAEFPRLNLRIITNAQLFTRARWAEFENLHEIPLIFDISVDAAEKETYETLRLGGKWETLRENMKLTTELREAGNIKRLTLNFVVQQENFRQMPAFVTLGKQWKADVINFQFMTNWGTNTQEEYQAKNVFDPANPNYEEAMTSLRELVETTSGIKILQNIF